MYNPRNFCFYSFSASVSFDFETWIMSTCMSTSRSNYIDMSIWKKHADHSTRQLTNHGGLITVCYFWAHISQCVTLFGYWPVKSWSYQLCFQNLNNSFALLYNRKGLLFSHFKFFSLYPSLIVFLVLWNSFADLKLICTYTHIRNIFTFFSFFGFLFFPPPQHFLLGAQNAWKMFRKVSLFQ